MGRTALRIRIEHVAIANTSRSVNFSPGLNIIQGPIATGKTNLLFLCRVLLGARITSLIPELSGRMVLGRVMLGDRRFDLSRTLTTTATAKVDIAEVESDRTWRLPASAELPGYEGTFRSWLLEQLGLPELDVPIVPSREDSDLSPLTINDYMRYCTLRQDEIDSSVFGHNDYSVNNKRKYVFQVIYGILSVREAALRERLREVALRIRQAETEAETLEKVLADTPWANRAALERDLQKIEALIAQGRAAAAQRAARASQVPEGVGLRRRVQHLEQEEASLRERIEAEKAAIDSLHRLRDQLVAQSARLTRSIVADKLLVDFEFIRCPRCGEPVPERGSEDQCRLCSQRPDSQFSREEIINEQDRLVEQIFETDELTERSKAAIEQLQTTLAAVINSRAATSMELDASLAGFIAEEANSIAAEASEWTKLEERRERLRDYLLLWNKLDARAADLADLREQERALVDELERSAEESPAVAHRLHHLDATFESLLDRFNAPRFQGPGGARIDRRTYLPVIDGRRFDDLSSQGLAVLVNVAHALAHQITNIELDLMLPNILLIDGLTGNLGHEGRDLERVQGVYNVLAELSEERGNRLQIVIADNDVPHYVSSFVTLNLSDEDKLVPSAS